MAALRSSVDNATSKSGHHVGVSHVVSPMRLGSGALGCVQLTWNPLSPWTA